MLTNIRGTSVLAAGLALTVAAITWPAGSWWQSRQAGRMRAGTLVDPRRRDAGHRRHRPRRGAGGGPLALAYIGWAIAGFGMGVAYPTIPLAVMARAEAGREAAELSPTLLMDMLGIAAGAGFGGAAIAFAASSNATLRSGIAGAFAVALLASLILLGVGARIDPSR